MIRAFIFDIGNVLLRFDFSLAQKRLQSRTDLASEALVELWEPIKLAYENGDISRVEFQQRVMEVLQFAGTEREFVTAWEEIFAENEPMSELIRKLHTRYPLFLLSNTSDLHMDYIFRTYPVFSLFNDAVYSYRAKCSKPGREIFEIAVRQFGVTPSKTIYIDDLAPNVETALQLGFRAIQYDPDDHASLLDALALAGVDCA